MPDKTIKIFSGALRRFLAYNRPRILPTNDALHVIPEVANAYAELVYARATRKDELGNGERLFSPLMISAFNELCGVESDAPLEDHDDPITKMEFSQSQ
ncbi:6096_t:CDS:2 [Acaulospora colombiana]|uniref:6096_t:CDS:1 n=1 Tax=Acaulospora colombiana TaxID=27376 RepID=A0ACA9K0A9_9GLOM|nr:6096_t:CDS:2 [Acaulospora colombiana]